MSKGGQVKVTLEGQMDDAQHNCIVCLLLKEPRPVAFGWTKPFPFWSSTAFPPHFPPFLTMWQCNTQDTGPHPCPNLVLCAFMSSVPLWPPSLPFLLEIFYSSIKVTCKHFSLKPPLILASSHRRHASVFIQYYWNTEHILSFRTWYIFPCCYAAHSSKRKTSYPDW